MAENTMGNVNNNSGIVTQGQIGNNTLVQGNQRLQYSDALAEQLVSKLTDKAKPVRLMSIGGNADQETGSKFQAFLERRGFKVERMAIGQMAPPPERKLIYQETPQEYVVQVAPSAVE